MGIVFLNLKNNVSKELFEKISNRYVNCYFFYDITDLFNTRIKNNAYTFFIFNSNGNYDANGQIPIIKTFFPDSEIIVFDHCVNYNNIRNAFLLEASDYIVMENDFDLESYIEKYKVKISVRNTQMDNIIYNNLDESYNLKKEKIISDLIESNVMNVSKNNRWINDFNLGNYKNYLVIKAEMSIGYEFALEDAFKDLLEVHLEILYEHLDENKNTDLLFIKADFIKKSNCVIGLIYNDIPDFKNNYRLFINLFFQNTFNSFKKQTNIEFNMGVSSVFDNIQEISNQYNNACNALNEGLYNINDEGNVYFNDDPHCFYNKHSQGSIDDFLEEIDDALELKNKELLIIKCRNFTKNFIDMRLSKEETISRFEAMLFRIEHAANKANFNFSFNINEQLTIIKAISRITKINPMIETLIEFIDKNLIYKNNTFIASDSINKAIEYINNNYEKKINLSTVSAYVFLGPNYFSGLFKKSTGKNFSEYLTQVRMIAALKLLKKTNKTVYEIANDVGYPEVVSFNRVFKKYYNCYPTKYRKE